MLLAQFFLAVRQNNLYQITPLDLDGRECFAVIPEPPPSEVVIAPVRL